MKRLFISAIIILLFHYLRGQDGGLKGWWVDGSTVIAITPRPLFSNGNQLSFNIAFKPNHSISFSYNWFFKLKSGIIFTGPGLPEIESYNLMYGWLYNRKYAFINCRAGLGFIRYQYKNSVTDKTESARFIGIPLEVKGGLHFWRNFKVLFTLHTSINIQKPHSAALFGIGIGHF